MKFARFVLFTIERLEVVEATLARNLALELFEFIEAHPCGVLLVCFKNLACLLKEEDVSVWVMFCSVQ